MTTRLFACIHHSRVFRPSCSPRLATLSRPNPAFTSLLHPSLRIRSHVQHPLQRNTSTRVPVDEQRAIARPDRTNERRGREREERRGEERRGEERGEAAEFLAYRGANWLASDLRYCKPMRRRRPCPPPEPQSNSGDFDLQCQRHVVPTVTLFRLAFTSARASLPAPTLRWTSPSSSPSNGFVALTRGQAASLFLPLSQRKLAVPSNLFFFPLLFPKSNRSRSLSRRILNFRSCGKKN